MNHQMNEFFIICIVFWVGHVLKNDQNFWWDENNLVDFYWRMLWSKTFVTTTIIKTLKATLPARRSIFLTTVNWKKRVRHNLSAKRASPYDIMGPPPSLLQLTVLGNGYLGTPKSVVVRSERQVYIFNCGEGTQRSLVEFSGGVGMCKTKSPFIRDPEFSAQFRYSSRVS